MTKYNKIIHISKNNLISILKTSSSKHKVLKEITGQRPSAGDYEALDYVMSSYKLTFEEFNINVKSSSLSITERIDQYISSNLNKRISDVKYLIGMLIKEKTLEYKCYGEGCSIGNTWNGNPISLQLEHINGNSKDHRRENLTLLCPNCHSQTDTFALGHKRFSKLTESYK